MLQSEVKTEEPWGLSCLAEYTESILAYITTCVCTNAHQAYTFTQCTQRGTDEKKKNAAKKPNCSCYSSNFCCRSFLIRNFCCGFKNISLLLVLIVFPLYSSSLLIGFHFYIQYPHSVHFIIFWCDVSVYCSQYFIILCDVFYVPSTFTENELDCEYPQRKKNNWCFFVLF